MYIQEILVVVIHVCLYGHYKSMYLLTRSSLTLEVIFGDQTLRTFTSDRNSSTLENSPLPIPEANARNTKYMHTLS